MTRRFTDEGWFLYWFGNGKLAPGEPPHKAVVQTTDGALIAVLEAGTPRGLNGEEISGEFEGNARVMAAGQAMLDALRDAVAAHDKGFDIPWGTMKQAIAQAFPPLYKVVHDSRVMSRGTHDECFVYIQQHQAQSVDHAVKYEGWRIDPVKE